MSISITLHTHRNPGGEPVTTSYANKRSLAQARAFVREQVRHYAAQGFYTSWQIFDQLKIVDKGQSEPLSALALHILQGLPEVYGIKQGWNISESDIFNDLQSIDPEIARLCRYPLSFSNAMEELQQSGWVERDFLMPSWKLLKTPPAVEQEERAL